MVAAPGLARLVLGARAEPAADRRAVPDPGDQRPRLVRQRGGRGGQERLLAHPGRPLRRGRPGGRRVRGAESSASRSSTRCGSRRATRTSPPRSQQLKGAGCDVVFLVATPTDAGTIWARPPSSVRPAVDRPVADVDRRARRVAAGRRTSGQLPGGRRGHGVGRHERPGHEGHGRPRSRSTRPTRSPTSTSPSATTRPRRSRRAREGRRARRPLPGGHPQGLEELGTIRFDGLSGDYEYGPAEERSPPRTSTIFKVDPDKPFGLGTLEYQYESDAAEKFEFKKAEL